MVIRHSIKELLAKNSVTKPMKYWVVCFGINWQLFNFSECFANSFLWTEFGLLWELEIVQFVSVPTISFEIVHGVNIEFPMRRTNNELTPPDQQLIARQ